MRARKAHLALQTIRSTAQWPAWGWGKKLMLCVWLTLIYLLPAGAARRLALRQKSSIGEKDRMEGPRAGGSMFRTTRGGGPHQTR